MTLPFETQKRMAEERIAAEIAAFDYSSCKLVEITNIEQAKEEADEMKHELHAVWKRKMIVPRTRIFSVRDTNGKRILTISVNSEGMCKHVVGRYNRRPTRQEVGIVIALITPMAFVYDGTSNDF